MKWITIPSSGILDGARLPATTFRLVLIHAAAEFVISSPTWLSIGDNPIKPFMGKLVLEVFFVLLVILFAYLLSRMRGSRTACSFSCACVLPFAVR